MTNETSQSSVNQYDNILFKLHQKILTFCFLYVCIYKICIRRKELSCEMQVGGLNYFLFDFLKIRIRL